jgi:hypothetical protein
VISDTNLSLDEILTHQKERESLKASHYYKATSLESELKHQVTKTANLKAKINKIRSVLVALNQMVKIRSTEDEDANSYDND